MSQLDEDAWARVHGSGYSAPGFAALYDSAQPRVPAAMIALLDQMVGGSSIHLVVDLGCGTGVSTRPWAARATKVIGIEPNPAMRRQAEEQADRSANLHYREGLAHRTGLEDGCADIVTCRQALHWMEPAPTFAEVARILRPGGLFAAYDHEMLPVVSWAVDGALARFVETTKRIRVDPQQGDEAARRTLDIVKQRWGKEGHLQRLQASGHFRAVKHLWLHDSERAGAEKLVDYCRSIAGVNRLLMVENRAARDVLERLREELVEIMGGTRMTLYWSYRLWLGLR